jgi:hypothetical protein
MKTNTIALFAVLAVASMEAIHLSQAAMLWFTALLSNVLTH